MLRLLGQNPLPQITQSKLPFLLPKLVSNGASINPQTILSPLAVSFSSSAASNLRHESPEMKEPIFGFFHSYGFTDTQIERFIQRSPAVRSPETMKPKFEHLLSFGLSPSDLVRIISVDPQLLTTSLQERVKPNLKLLEATIGSKTHVIKTIKRGPWLLRENLEKRVIPNLPILRENSITTDTINLLFMRHPRVLLKDPNVIIETIAKLKGLGMNPSTVAFVDGINAMTVLKKETWERKMEIYRSLGWSEADTLLAFSRHPSCLTLSDDKIKKQMNFFIEKLRWDSAMVLRCPYILSFCLEGRIIPRCAVLNVLAKNGLWEGKPKVSLCTMSEKTFKERYMDKYEKEVPQVIDAYQGKINFVGFESIDG